MLRGLVISLCGTVLTILLIEAGFRVISSFKPEQIVSNVPLLDYIPQNAYRARDYYYPPEKTEGTFRIIAIGDSFTFGARMHFDDNYSKRLERMLNLNLQQRRAEVLNWGVSGYSTLHEVDLAKHAVGKFNPDMIVLQITLNDAEVQPFRVTHKYQNKRGEVILNNQLFKYWQSLGYLVKRIYFTQLNAEYISYHSAAFENSESWRTFANSLGEIKKTASNGGVPLLAIIFPMMSHPFDQRYPFLDVHKKIAGEMASQGIDHIDLLPDFQGRDPNTLQVEPGKDPHPNEIAHRIAADRIYLTLQGRGWLPKDIEIKRYSKRMSIKPYLIRPDTPTP